MNYRDRIVGLRRVPANLLIDHDRNWRIHSVAQSSALRGALKEVGWADAIKVRELPDGRFQVVDGHLRKAMDDTVPVLVLDLNDAEALQVLATMDPISAMAESGATALASLLSEVRFDDGATQRMLDELAKSVAMPEAAVDEDEVPALPIEPVTKVGDLWLMGDHRLLCGDSTSRDAVGIVMDGSMADMVFTDPPYGHNNNNGDLIHNREAALGKKKTKSSAARPILNDGDEANDVVKAFFAIAAEIVVPGGCCCCCCCGGGPDPQFARWSLWLDAAIPFKMCVVWDKDGLGMGWHYRRNWECILVAQQPGAACKWYGGNDVPNVIRDIGKVIPSAQQHPTEKPVALPKFFLDLHSQPGEVVFEPFCGGGSTLIAAEMMGRKCYAMELDPAHCDATVSRWERMTGKKAILDSPQNGNSGVA